MKKTLLALFILASCSSVFAAETPTPAEAKKVFDFYYHGQGQGVVLMETKLCAEIGKQGDTKNECTIDLNNSPAKGQIANLWMTFLVPKGDKKIAIIIQFEQGGITRMVKNVTLSGSIRFRTWRKVKFNKTGNWTVKIFQEVGDTTKVLKEITLTVQEAPPAEAP